MPHRHPIAPTTLFILGLLAGCGADQGSSSTPPPNPDPTNENMIGDFDLVKTAQELAAAQCNFISRCVPALYDFQSTDETSCLQDSETSLVGSFEMLREALVAERVRFQPTKLNECKQLYNTADCALDILETSACSEVLVGTLPLDQSCFLSAECSDGLFCRREQGLGSCGACKPLAARGASCAESPCVPDTACIDIGQEAPQPTCIPTDAPENGACLTVETGLCRGSLQCVGDQQSGFSCQRPRGMSETCDPEQTSAPDCNLAGGLSCASGQCAPVTWVGTGQPCNDTALCNAEGYCAQGAGQCTPLPKTGESCAQLGVCGQDAYCDSQGTCRPFKAMGSVCESSRECTGDLYCIGASGQAKCGELTFQMCGG